jgi:hypothetical protein
MYMSVVRVASGALIPSVASIVFNLLNFFVDNAGKTPMPHPTESAFDISVGCVFSILGIAITSDSKDASRWLFVCAILILLASILCEILGPAFWQWDKNIFVWIVNAISFAVLSAAIIVA